MNLARRSVSPALFHQEVVQQDLINFINRLMDNLDIDNLLNIEDQEHGGVNIEQDGAARPEVDFHEDPDQEAFYFQIQHHTGIGELNLAELAQRFNLNRIYADDRSTLRAQQRALMLLSKKYSFDWASAKLPFPNPVIVEDIDNVTPEPPEIEYSFEVYHFLDFLHIQGLPNRPLTSQHQLLVQFEVQLTKWKIPFPPLKSSIIPFKLNGLSFYLGSNGSIHWSIIMHPPQDEQEPGVNRVASGTPLNQLRGLKLLHYILSLFESEPLLHTGINSRNYKDPGIRRLSGPDFFILQQSLLNNWDERMRADPIDDFWNTHTPIFHAYNIGTNENLPRKDPFILLLIISGNYDGVNVFTREFINALQHKFNRDAIYKISLSLATEVEICDHTLQTQDPDNPVLCAGLPSAPKVKRNFNRTREVDIYPVAFSPNACCFQAKRTPRAYKLASDPILRNISANNNDEDIVSFTEFQVYSTAKQLIRPNHYGMHANNSIITGSVCLAAHRSTQAHRRKVARLTALCDAKQPFAQIIEAVDTLTEQQRIRTRFEPIVNIAWDRLAEENRTFQYLADQIVDPLLEIFDDFSAAICYELIDIYPLEVLSPSNYS